MKLKEKIYLYVNYTTQRRPNKITKTFLIENFFLPTVNNTGGAPLTANISANIQKKFKTALIGLGETDS
jgi:hypothetical protein